MASHTGVIRRQNISLGRSGPRSKTGCQTCRLRRVRCDEKRPVCGHCNRLKLECGYQNPQQRRRRQRQNQSEESTSTTLRNSEEIDSTMDRQNRQNQHSIDESMADESGQDLGLGNDDLSNMQSVEQEVDDPSQESHAANTIMMLSQTEGPSIAVDTIQSIPQNATAFDFGAMESHGSAAPMDDTTASVMPNFTSIGQERNDWSFNAFSDYLPLPDPAFSFTSLGFTNSMPLFETDHASVTQPITTPGSGRSWRGDLGRQRLLTFESPAGSAESPSSQSGAGRQTLQQTREPAPISGSVFAVSPPILSSAQEEQLLALFETDVRPPASLMGVDPLGWFKIRRYILRMAKEDNGHVMVSLYALSALMSGSKPALHRIGINEDNYTIFALRLHDAACAAIEVTLAYTAPERQNFRALLVSIFLLAWFEIVQDEENQARPIFPTGMAEQIIVKGRDWDAGSAHLFQWLDSFDAKASHLGGSHLLSESSLEVVRKSQSTLAVGEPVNEGDQENLAGDNNRDEGTQRATYRGSQTPREKSGNRLGYLLSIGATPSLPRSVIRLDVFNILLHPAFEFHMTSQAYSRRIGCYDRHHRSRGTPEDEREVMNACMAFEEELQELWKRRPGVLGLSAEQLGHFVSRDIAARLEQLFSIYIATFWNHFVYIHRVAFWTLKHTPIVHKALEEQGNMMRRSVGQPIHQHEFDRSLRRTANNCIHPGLMWVCFMFGCEVEDPVQQEWAVLQLRALGKLSPAASSEESSDGEDELLAFRLDEKGAQTATKASKLLAILIDRQKTLGARVDGKYLSQEIFGCHFYII